MKTYSFKVVLEDGVLKNRRMKAPTRSEARGWLKKRLRSEGVNYSRIISVHRKGA